MNRKHWTNRSGYIYIFKREHPNSGKQGYVAQHRLVMEAHLGRFLTKKEIVHHRNEIKTDNRLENLELVESAGKHIMLHHPEIMEKFKRGNDGISRSPETEFKKGKKPWNTGKGKPMPKCPACGVFLKDRRSLACRNHRKVR